MYKFIFVLFASTLCKISISNGEEIHEVIQHRRTVPIEYDSFDKRSISEEEYDGESEYFNLNEKNKILENQLEYQRLETKKCNKYRDVEKQKFENKLAETQKKCNQFCPEKDINKQLKRLSTGRYYFSKKRVSWFEAEYFCHTNKMELASIENERENNIIVKELVASGLMQNSGSTVWISGNDLKREGKWTWISNLQEMDFDSWLPNEPNNHGDNQHCAVYGKQGSKIGWDDFYCDNKSFFICELPTYC